ncbi:MAG: MATE family efflux transporter, partial [Phenylobacterium sp.]
MDPALAQTPGANAGRLGPFRTDLSALLRLSGPVVLSRLGIMAMGLTDAIVVGRYSA